MSNRAAQIIALGTVWCALALAGCSSSKPAATGEQNPNPSEIGTTNQGGSLENFSNKGTVGTATSPLSDIHFEYNQYAIQPQDGSILQQDASWLRDHPNTRTQIEGHCDERGSEEYNIALGAKRAQAAKDYLVTLGIAANRLSTISYGKELPLCTEHDESCWAQNRRAHFVVSQ
ncbi:MAG TPA: peptidoglycan-associated lipoprotein Pal [Candidatus Binataceae bacterium]|nr:peptidoglycan-associated lipoprotein Pal [Candidatus Binataceae bacterium]